MVVGQKWDLTADKDTTVMTDPQKHPIQSISMATNASVTVGANNKGMVYVFGSDAKVSPDSRRWALGAWRLW